MKRLLILFLLSTLVFAAPITTSYAQGDETTTEVAADTDEDAGESAGLRETLKKWYIDGGWGFMTIVLICLILGLALSIERIITLNLNSVDSQSLTNSVSDKIRNGDIAGAKELCRSTRGPVASIMYQGMSRADDGIEKVESAVVSYANVQMGKLEKGLSWISLFIAIAPMLGFMGTVIGMVNAFDAIEQAGDISPQIVAGGIKVALLTTVFGLVVAIILQIFYNYILSKIDGMVNDMEEASITMVDAMSRK